MLPVSVHLTSSVIINPVSGNQSLGVLSICLAFIDYDYEDNVAVGSRSIMFSVIIH